MITTIRGGCPGAGIRLRPTLLGLLCCAALVAAARVGAQTQAPSAAAPVPQVPAGAPAAGAAPAAAPATFPDQQRPPGDPAVVAHGARLYAVNCKACHGGDLRGGDLGGPNLLRSQVVMSDQDGEAISQVVLKGRPNPPGGGTPMPAFPLAAADVHAISEYIHDVLRSKQRQGAPPPGAQQALDILVGDVAAGRRYFRGHCAGCHSPAGDLKGIATRATDAGALQDAWVAGRPPLAAGANPFAAMFAPVQGPPIKATLTLGDGTRAHGTLLRIDDFTVSLNTDDGGYRSFVRDGSPGVRAVDVDDPMAAHRHLLGVLTDRDLHNVTAYLATFK